MQPTSKHLIDMADQRLRIPIVYLIVLMKIVATYAELELLGSFYCIDSYLLSFIHVMAEPTKRNYFEFLN